MTKTLALLLMSGALVVTQRAALTREETGVIAGRIVRSNGQIAPDVGVEVLELQIHNGETRLARTPTSRVRSNDRGEFRISVVPGDYYVRTVNENAPLYGNTYFPGTPNVRDARRIRVQKHAEVSGIIFVHFEGPMRRLQGKFSGMAAGGLAYFSFYPRNAIPGADGPSPSLMSARKNGEFLIGVNSGSWDVYVGHLDTDRPNRLLEPLTHTGKLQIDVADHDIDGLVVPMNPTATIRGSVVVPPGFSAKGIRVELGAPSDFSDKMFDENRARKTLDSTGAFVIPGVPTSSYKVIVRPLPAGTYIGDILAGSESAYTKRLVVANEPQPELRILLKDDGATISGKVQTAEGTSAAGAFVFAVPPVDLRWNPQAYFQTTTKDDGTFSIGDVAPGAYELFAWEYVPRGRANATVEVGSEFIEEFREKGIPIRVGPRAKADNLPLELIPWK